jgi:hypothetical protein
MSPEDVPDNDVRSLLSAMQDTQLRAMMLYAKFLEKRG